MLLALRPAALLLDLELPDGSGLDLIEAARSAGLDPAAIVITGHGSVNAAVEAMRAGAYDFLVKPVDAERLLTTLRNALERRRLAQIVGTLGTDLGAASFEGFIGADLSMQAIYRVINLAARSRSTVFITGESGTGKEICAEAIHRRSPRRNGAFIALNCGAVPKELMESEIFGHVKGAFTGAAGERIGRLKAADKSTLFLDEIGNLPLHLQPKLLTALEQREVVPVGANKPIPIDVRVIAATNVSTDQLSDEKRFRQDLLFRLNTIEIELPPLRQRRDDIPELLDHYLRLYERKYDKPARDLPPAVLQVLIANDWPGNVRALRHAAERAVIMAEGDRYRTDDFPLARQSQGSGVLPSASDTLNLDQLEKQMIERALRMHHFNISLAAGELGLSRGALYRRMEKHGL
jgi:DNA-binding NtrC family response regulator